MTRLAATVLLLAWAVGWSVARLPTRLKFVDFAFGDPGAVLSADLLLVEGLKPAVDFSYLYGLLPLALGRAWFEGFGRSPSAYVGLISVLNLLTVFGLARLWVLTGASRTALAILFAAVPFGVGVIGNSTTHAAEPAVLVWALVALAAGRPPLALALVTIGVTVKPSLSYLAGAVVLTGMMVSVRGAGGWRALLRGLVPAALTAVVLGVGLALAFGLDSLAATLLPFTGMGVYRAEGFGFFYGLGRHFCDRTEPTSAITSGQKPGSG
jgi:hypothetical protein